VARPKKHLTLTPQKCQKKFSVESTFVTELKCIINAFILTWKNNLAISMAFYKVYNDLYETAIIHT